jgi:hypothetical protein
MDSKTRQTIIYFELFFYPHKLNVDYHGKSMAMVIDTILNGNWDTIKYPTQPYLIIR